MVPVWINNLFKHWTTESKGKTLYHIDIYSYN